MAALKKFGVPQEILESYPYPGVYRYLYDDADSDLMIECIVRPLQAIGVSFVTEEHDRLTIHLLEKLATVLDYDCRLDSDAA